MSELRHVSVHCPLDRRYQRHVEMFSKSLLTIPTEEHPRGQANGQTAKILPRGEKTDDEYSLVLVVECEAPVKAELNNVELRRAAFKEARLFVTERLNEAVRHEELAAQRAMRESHAMAIAEFW